YVGCSHLHVISISSDIFSTDRNHSYLRSFPTRRSSDLGDHRAARLLEAVAHGGGRERRERLLAVPEQHGAADTVLLGDVENDLRSEEHTSELQSRENLVCRLLLEKKNCDMISDKHIVTL